MVIPMQPGDYQDLLRMSGVDVDLTGVVRVLPAKQKLVPCRGMSVPESKCEDWELPVLPDAQIHWPAVSITVVRALRPWDRADGGRRRGARTLAETGVAAAAAEGKPVRAIGQFRGANLCRDLPAESRRDPADWVLLTSEGPLWVTGRRPAGKGFQLDPAYRADTTRWLEVSGKVQVAGEVERHLKAGKVALIRPARGSRAGPAPALTDAAEPSSTVSRTGRARPTRRARMSQSHSGSNFFQPAA